MKIEAVVWKFTNDKGEIVDINENAMVKVILENESVMIGELIKLSDEEGTDLLIIDMDGIGEVIINVGVIEDVLEL